MHKRSHEYHPSFACQICGRSGSANDDTLWNSQHKAKMRFLAAEEVMEKTRICKHCKDAHQQDVLEYQASEHPKCHQSSDQPDDTTPSRCLDCHTLLEKGNNISPTQMKHKKYDDIERYRKISRDVERHLKYKDIDIYSNILGAPTRAPHLIAIY